MRMSIFHLNSNKTYKDEYSDMIKVFNSRCVVFQNKEYTYFDFINQHVFHNWKFRGTYLDCYEYLESIGISLKNKKISKDSFLNFLEFLLNIQLLVTGLKYYADHVQFSIKCKSILTHNIPLLLDSYGYQAYSLDDRILILEKDIDYDDFVGILPDDIYELLLSYKNVNNNGIKMKRMILYKIYQFLIQDIDRYKSYNTSVFNSMKLIVLKMGVCGNIDKKYMSLSNYKLRKYYDYCFQMMVYLIRTENILKYREELKKELS